MDQLKIFVWRFVRVFLATFIAEITVMQLKWDNPKVLAASIATGAIAALAKVIRDESNWKKLPL